MNEAKLRINSYTWIRDIIYEEINFDVIFPKKNSDSKYKTLAYLYFDPDVLYFFICVFY